MLALILLTIPIGRERLMRIKDCMTRSPITVSPIDNIQDTFQILIQKGIHQVPVVRNGEIVGIVTDGDLRVASSEDAKQPTLKVASVMSRNPVSVTDDLKIVEAAKIIRKRRFNVLPVVDKKVDLVGIVTLRDILDGLINLLEISR